MSFGNHFNFYNSHKKIILTKDLPDLISQSNSIVSEDLCGLVNIWLNRSSWILISASAFNLLFVILWKYMKKICPSTSL